jgi:hypothetical protein
MGDPFVGRAAEIAQLEADIDAALAGSGRLIVRRAVASNASRRTTNPSDRNCSITTAST